MPRTSKDATNQVDAKIRLAISRGRIDNPNLGFDSAPRGFVQSEQLVKLHGAKPRNIAIYGHIAA
jgi:hypothetical protein